MSHGKHRKHTRRGRGRSAVVAAASVIGASAGLVFTASPASAATIPDTAIAQAAQNAGLPSCRGISLATWVAVALAESGGNTTAHATVGEDSRGLWQINMRAHSGWVGSRNLWDPNVNAWAAKRVCDMQGINAWSAYTKGMHHRFMGRGQAAAAAVGSGRVSTTAAVSPTSTPVVRSVATFPTCSGHASYLRMGMGGVRGDVRDLQQKLADLGYPIAVDGVFGPQTNHMVIDFQKNNGLVPDGVVGPLTHGKVFGC